MKELPKFKFRNFTSPSKSHAISKDGIVASSHPLSSQLGLDLLKDGANAADVAIAMSIVLCFAEPHMTGIGGDCFALISKSGIKFIFNKSFKSFNIDEKSRINVVLSDDTKITSGMVLISAGSQPNDLLFKNIKINEFNKIKVNSFLETNIDDIYAIGDCCFFDYYSKEVRLESIQNATDQAKTVAKNILGMKKKYNFVPWFWSDQFNIKLQIVGLLDLNSNIEIKVLGSQENSKFSNFIFSDNQLLAVESINSPGHHLIMKNNWEKRYSLTKDKFESDLNLKNFFNSLP